jgi:hypothetical protein
MDNLDSGATTEIENIEIPEEQPMSMDDTIRDTLRSIQEKNAEIPAEQSEVPLDASQKAERIRDAKGKFAEKPLIADPNKPENAPAEIKAPNTWKKEAQDAFIKADPLIRAEVERREADFHKGIEQYRNAASFAQNIERAITPYIQTIKSLGLTPEVAISELMAADHKLRYGSAAEKTAYLAQLAHNYGVDLTQSAQTQQKIDPRVYQLEQENIKYRNFLQNQQLMGERQQEQTLNSEIAQFAADPKHSHFESVKSHMAALLQAGQAKDLSDAYEQAIYANPTTRATVLQQIAIEQREENAKKAQAAKNAASANLRKRPSMPVSKPIGTMEDTIRDTFRRLTGAT